MEPRYRFRLFLLTIMVLLGCGVLLSRLHEFQIEKRSMFIANVPTTHSVTVREPGVRGIIQDRNGVILARNRRSYEVVFNLEDIYQSYRQQNDFTEADLLEEKVQVGGMPKIKKKKDIVRIVNEWVVPRLETHGLGKKRFTRALKTHYETHRGLVPFPYRTDLTYDEFAQLAERSLDFPGVQVTVVPRRVYPYGTLACHLLGQVKQWEKGDIPEEYRKSRMHYQGEDQGISGVEYTMDAQLRGKEGRQIFIRNEKNKIIGVEDYSPPQQGAAIELTIDARMQYVVENFLRRIGRGSAVVMDPSTGEVLAMASLPNFDPNDFVPSITLKKFKAYNDNKANPFLNRALNTYFPGSTFKLPTAIAGCIHGKTNSHHRCVGYSSYGKNLKIRCWKTEGHGTLGLSEALQRSCNPYFMDMANDLGSRTMADTFNLLGLGRKTGIKLPSEQPGMVPGTKTWIREKSNGKAITPAQLGMVSIGQFHSGASPLQMCAITATIANGGKYYQPRIVRRVINSQGQVEADNIPIVKVDLLKEGLKKKSLSVIQKGMWMAVNQKGGTAQRTALKDIHVAAKTGTAQTGQPDHRDKNIAWTVSYAPYEKPKFAVAVMVENGRSGGKVAGALTHLILRGLFAIDNGFQPRITKMGLYKGHFKAIEEILLPEGDLLALDIDDIGETGNEIDPILLEEGQAIRVTPKRIILPSIAPQADTSEGTTQ